MCVSLVVRLSEFEATFGMTPEEYTAWVAGGRLLHHRARTTDPYTAPELTTDDGVWL